MTSYKLLLENVQNLGMDKKWSNMFVKKFINDEKLFPTTAEEKEWAMKKGFIPGRISLYGLNEENYKNYLPDWNYFMIHPINHHFRIWVNDKLSLKYVLNSNGLADTMPEYYLYVENDGTYTYLFDAPENIKKDKDFIYHLLQQKGCLAMKPNSGTSGGFGFMKMELIDGILYENNHPIDQARFQEILTHMPNYIVTEYTKQHDDLAKIWGESECTLRVIMFKKPKKDPYAASEWGCSAAIARFGSSLSGGASNLSSGGLGIGFDFETGKYRDFAVRYKQFCEDGNTMLAAHPDSGAVWKGNGLPNWALVKEKIERICDHISSLSYLGLDIIITNDGLKLCEINTHPGGDYAQVSSGPILARPGAEEFFASKGLWNFSGEDFYQAYLNSQE